MERNLIEKIDRHILRSNKNYELQQKEVYYLDGNKEKNYDQCIRFIIINEVEAKNLTKKIQV